HASRTGSARDSQYSFYKGCVCHHHVRGADSPAVFDAQRTVALITDIEVTGVLPDRFFAADSNRADAAQSIAADIADRIVDCAAALHPKGAGADGACANEQLSGVGPVRSGTGDCHFTDSFGEIGDQPLTAAELAAVLDRQHPFTHLANRNVAHDVPGRPIAGDCDDTGASTVAANPC